MIRTSISRARGALTGLALGTALALAPAPAHAFWDTQKAWNDVLQFAVKQVNAPGEFEIILGEVTKPEEGFALISTLQIKDSDGVWFDADNLLVDWSASALLRGRFTFETLSAEQITVLRAPIGRGEPPAEDAPDIAFAWPRAPVPIAIDTLRIDRLRLEGGLLPQDLEASVEGGFSDIGDVQEAELAVQRTDRPGDRIALTSRIDFDDLDIAFTLEATEEPGGLVAQMASLPPDQALEMRLQAEGTPESLPFELFADIGQIGIATGTGEASWAELITARFDGTVEPGEETSADWRRALGEAARITVDFEETARGTYDLKALGIDSEAFELTGQGIVDVGRNAIDMALDWDVKDIDAFNQVIAPAQVSDLTGTARATGALTAPKLDVNARVAGLEAGFGTADAILLRIDSQPVDGEIGEVGKQQGFDFEARAEGLALADAGIQSALGPTPSLTGSGTFDGIAQLVTLETLAVDARSVRLDGSASYNLGIGEANAELAGEARELGPFFRAAGLPIDGRAALSFELDGLQGGTLDRLSLNAQMTDLSSDDSDIAAALGEEAVLDLLLTESGAETIRVERGVLDSEVLRVEASGTVSVPNDAVDLAVEFDLRDAAAVSALAEPGRIASAQGSAALTGSLSEPQVRLDATATGLGFEEYAAETARIEGDVQYRLDRRAPFDATVALTGVRTGDPGLDRVIGEAPEVAARGLYDTATGLLTLETAQIDLADADVGLTGDIHLNKRTLDITYDLDAGDLGGFETLVGVPLAGSVDLSGAAEGAFALPFVTAKGSVRDLRYDTYAVEAADLDIEMDSAADGPSPFRVDVTATNPRTGDPDLDALIGDAPSLRAAGTLDRAGPAVELESFDADFAALQAEAQGSVDLGTRLLDLSFDVEAERLDGLSALLGTEIAGSVVARGSASGSFTAPQVKATLNGQGLRYDTYAAGSITGRVDVEQAASGFAPFDVNVEARDVTTGDAALDALLVGASTLRATGSYNQADQQVRIEAASAQVAGAEADLSGEIDIARRFVDVDFDMTAADLSPFEPLVGVPLAGSISAAGEARGALTAPQVDIELDGRGLRYDTYAVAAIEGDIDIQQAETGFAPFDIDVTASGIETGDPALDDVLDGETSLRATGAFDRSTQRVRIESATARAAGAEASLSGAVDIAARALDIAFDVEAEDLSAFEGLAGAPLAGTVSARGTAGGDLSEPTLDLTLSGNGLRYDAYRVGTVEGTVALDPGEGDFAPFSVDLAARNLTTGDAALDEALTSGVRVDAAGGLDLAGRRLRLDRADIATDALTAEAAGTVDLGARTLDVRFDLDADDLSSLSSLAGAPLDGSLDASGTAAGPFVLPELDVTLSGEGLRYDSYRIAALSGTATLDGAASGLAPFDVDLTARGIRTGDAALDEVIGGTVAVDASGGFDREARRLRLDTATVDSDFATAEARGTVDLGAGTLDIAYDLDARRLAALEPLLGVPVGGSVALEGTARGPLSLPAVDATLSGRNIAYDRYTVDRLDGRVDTGEGAPLPFDIDVTASGIGTGDPALDTAIGERVALTANGTFDRDAQVLDLGAARLDAVFVQGTARGTVDLAAQRLDIAYDLDAGDLSPIEAIAGVPLGGAVSLEGTARGPFSLPAVDADLSARNLVYDAYGAGALDGSVRLGLPEDGFSPFSVDLRGADLALGDPALEAALGTGVTVEARGAVDIDGQRLRLDGARVETVAATVAARGSIDLAGRTLDITYDVEAGDLSPFGPLAGADLGGALSLSGSAQGPFVIPRVNADIDASGLRYQQYTVASLTGAVEMGAPRGGTTPFSLGLAAAGIGTGNPALDAALTSGVSLDARGGVDLEAQRVRLDGADLRTPFADASASGTADLKGRSLDMRFALDASDLSPLSAVVGTPLGGALRASGTAQGPFDAPRVNLDAEGAGLFYDGYGLSGLSLDLEMPGDAPGYLPFSLTGALTGPQLNDARLETLVGPRIDLRAAGVFDPSRQLLRLTDAQVNTNAAGVAAFGDVDLANGLLAVNAYLNARDLSVAQPFAGATLAGSAQARARITGALADPTVVGRLSGANLVYDTYDVPELTAFYDLRNLTGGPAGSVAVNARTDVGPLSAKARFDLGGGTTRIDELTVQGLGLGVDGRFSMVGGLVTGDATLNATDIGQIGAFIGQPLAGQVNGTVSLDGMQGRQNATFDVRGNGLRYGPADDPTLRLSVFTAKGQVSDAFGADPVVDATVGGGEGTVAGVPLTRLDATARGPFSALDVTLEGRGGPLGSDRIETAARLNIANQPRSATVSRLALLYDGRQASIVRPVVIEEMPPGGVRVSGLDLRAEDGAMQGALEYSAAGLVADLTIRNFPLTLANLAGVDVIRSGRLDGTVDVDTRGGARGTLALDAYALRLAGAQIDDPFALTATGAMDGTALTFEAQMSGAQLVEPLTASARIPLMASGGPLPLPDRNAPFSAQVDWQGDVGEIWAFVPLPDHILTGPVVLRGRAGGTLAAPSLSGGAVLSDGRYSNVEFGTLLTALTVQADFTQDGRAVFEMTANDGVEGTLAASGSYVVADGTLDTRLSLNNAALVRRDDATAILSGEATAVSRGNDIAVTGDFRTNYVELRLIGNFGGSLTVVDAIPVGESAPLYTPPAEETAADRRILLDVSLSMPNRVFVRGRGLDSEWGGRLDVAGTARNPRVNGLIERRRGVLDFLGRQFELAIGEVRFTGDVLPFVQVRLQREANGITGWIEVIGEVPDVELEFGSVPALPEGEILPRLLFGRSQQSLTALEAAQLAAGVATLLSGRAGVLDTVRDAVGVDVLRVESDVDGGTSIITGKYLRDEVFVGAKQNLQRGETSGLVEIEVFDDFEIEAELGSEEAKGSVGWQIEY